MTNIYFGGCFSQKGSGNRDRRNVLFMWAYITVYAFKISPCLWICRARCWKPTAWFLSVYQFGCVSFSSLSHLTPSERCYLCFGFFHHSPRCFSPSYFISGSDVLVFCLFFSSHFFPFPLPCHFLSLSFRPASLPTVIFHLLPPPSLSLPQQNKAGIVLRDGSCSKLKYHYPFDCHLDVLENFAVFLFCLEKLSACQRSYRHTMDCFNFAQLALHSFETSLIKEMDRCLAVFPLMERAFITLHV